MVEKLTTRSSACWKTITCGANRNVASPSVLVERLQHYFLTYKLVPGQRPQARIAAVYGRSHALKVVRAAMADYDDHFVL